MKKLFIVKMSIVAMAATCIIGCSSMNTSTAPAVSPEGMLLKKSTYSTTAYLKAGVDFADYNQIHILPSKVAFKKNWQRSYNRQNRIGSQRLTDEDVVNIKADVAKLFDETFSAELSKSTLFSIVDHAGIQTLLLKPMVIDLDINAPDVNGIGNTKTYVEETGEATLYLEIYDSVSGEILARIIDEEIIGDNSYFGWANKIKNRIDTKRVIRKWAKVLRTNFDKAHTK
ncbi:MAG: DUF3313 family protein [Colwellia sp.]